VSDDGIFFVGNTMIDTLLASAGRLVVPLVVPPVWEDLGLKSHNYFVLMLHHPANADEERSLGALLAAIGSGARDLPVVFRVHLRTAKRLQGMTDVLANIHMVDPQPYLEFNYLVRHARAVLTDSEGITEETTGFDVPCMTLRNASERPETVTLGTNELLGTDPAALPPRSWLFAGAWKQGGGSEKW
jgi:UDP-N-acetylglucosamine 2-epimerase (non-hydrolysing)